MERSTEGQVFSAVGTVPGAGTSTGPRTYGLLDSQLPPGATLLYYRLLQTDFDGTSTYSPVRTVVLTGKAAAAQLLAYPNPAHDAVRVLLVGPSPAAPLQVFDALGRVVRSQPAPTAGTEAVLPLTGLPTGVYLIRCGNLSQRLTVE